MIGKYYSLVFRYSDLRNFDKEIVNTFLFTRRTIINLLQSDELDTEYVARV